jgi:hypothetical protein
LPNFASSAKEAWHFSAARPSGAPSARVIQLRLLALMTVNVDRFAIIDSALQDGVRSSIGAFQ